MIGQSEVIIARPGFFDPQIVQVSPPSLAWRTDGPGSLECSIELQSLVAANLRVQGTTTPLKGKWIWFEHPTAGPWAGVIQRTEVGPWFCQIVAEQFNVLMRKRKVPGTYRAVGIAPGSLALQFVNSAERQGESFLLTGTSVQETGDAVDIEPRGGDLCDDILPMLAKFGYQWRVRTLTMDERLFEFRQRVGVDNRGDVLISEGRHIVSTSLTGDLWTVANSIEGIPGDQPFKTARGYEVEDKGSIRTLGRRYQETIAYTGVATRSTLVPLIEADLALRKYPQEIAQFEVVDEDMIFAEFREGDIISVSSASANVVAPFEVDIRSLNGDTNVMTIAGRLRTEEAWT